MKKLVAIALALIIGGTSVCLSSCNVEKQEKEDQIKSQVYDITEDLKSDMKESSNVYKFASKLSSYCNIKNLETKLVDNNVIVDLKATKGYEKAESNIIVVEFSEEDYKKSCQQLAMAIATAKNSESHGKIRYIFSPKVDGKSVGINKLNSSYLKYDNLISFMDWEKTEIFNGSASTNVYEMKSNISKESPEGNMAYKISVSNLIACDSGDRTDKHTNPITYLSKLLSDAKSSGISFELAEFKTSGSTTEYPIGAEATIIIDSGSQNKLESRLEKDQEEFDDKNRKRDPDAVFAFEETAIPDTALNYDDTSNLLALLYTLEDGIFATTEEDYEGDILGLSTIYKVSISASDIKVYVMGRNIDKSTEKSMGNEFKLTANLLDYSFKASERYPLWAPSDENKIIKDGKLKDALESKGIDRKVKYTFKENVCSIIQNKNKKINLVSLGVNMQEANECTLALIQYFESLNEK